MFLDLEARVGARETHKQEEKVKNTIVNKTNNFKLNRDVTSKKLRPPEFKIMMLFESNQDEKSGFYSNTTDFGFH